MNKRQMKGDWRRVKSRIRTKWDELTDDEIDSFDGRRAHIGGPPQKRSRMAREEIEEQLGELDDRDAMA